MHRSPVGASGKRRKNGRQFSFETVAGLRSTEARRLLRSWSVRPSNHPEEEPVTNAIKSPWTVAIAVYSLLMSVAYLAT